MKPKNQDFKEKPEEEKPSAKPIKKEANKRKVINHDNSSN